MKTDRINIYINEKTKKKLCKYCKIHHVSFSTIAYYLSFCYMEITDALKDSYLINGNKTSIKPKITNKNYTKEERAKIYTNLIYLYFNGKTKEYIDEKRDAQLKDKFNKFIQEEQDVYANYNEYIRNTTRALKNKNVRTYFKKQIERQEQKHD